MIWDLLNRLLRGATTVADTAIAAGAIAEAEGRISDACERYRAAVRAAPRYASAHLNLGIGLEAAGNPELAMESFERALVLEPGNPFVNYNLAKLLYSRGSPQRATALLRAALESKPAFPEARVVLADLHDRRGDLAAAAAELEAALRDRPEYAGALLNYASVLEKLGRLSDAEDALRRCVHAQPENAASHWRLGNVLADQSRLEEAACCYMQALALKPDFVEAQHGLCMILYEQGRPVDAIACLRTLLSNSPAFARGHVSLGNILGSERRVDEAAKAFRHALEIDPKLVAAHLSLGDSYRIRDDMDAALRSYGAALQADPESVQARWSQALSKLQGVHETEAAAEQSRETFAQALDELDRWIGDARLGASVDAVGDPPPFYLAYQEQENRALLERHGALCSRVMGEWLKGERLPAPSGARPGKVIRVGVVSAHFQDHSVWNALVKGWFQEMDRTRFCIEAYSLGAYVDGETQRARSLAAHFEEKRGSVRAWVQAIAGRQPDVLIYPEIGMDPMTLKLASMRLAPVQLSTWGHPETTGLPTIDRFISAHGLEPENASAHYSERLELLPNLGCSYPERPIGANPPVLAGLGIDPSVPILVCPGTPFKYAPRHDGVLADIAARLGECRLIFFTHRVPELSQKLLARLSALFARRGLDPRKFISFIPWQSIAQFRGLMAQSDVFLDTLGFSGFNTAMEAVQCGLPIVTREGRFLRGRLASGILKRLQLHELVATSEEGYVELAVRICRDRDYRMHLREAIATRRPILFADSAPTRALEDLLSRIASQR